MTDSRPSPYRFQESTIHAPLERLDVTSRTPPEYLCGPAGEDRVRLALTDPETGFARSLERQFTEALWQPNRLCAARLSRPGDIANCRLYSGTNNVRTAPSGEVQFRLEVDRIEVFPDRLELVLTEEHWRTVDEPPPEDRVDRQVTAFTLAGGLCDDARALPASVDHRWARADVAP